VIAFVKITMLLTLFQQETLLLENYNHSDFKEALILMVNYVIEEKK
jgi:octaprenyl-diphosphate synthase